MTSRITKDRGPCTCRGVDEIAVLYHSLSWSSLPRVPCPGPWEPEKQSVSLTPQPGGGGAVGGRDPHSRPKPPLSTMPHRVPQRQGQSLGKGEPARGTARWTRGAPGWRRTPASWSPRQEGPLGVSAWWRRVAPLACPAGWGSGSRRLCSRCLSLAAGLCPPPSFGFSRGWGLRWASTERCIHPDTTSVPRHCPSKYSQPPPAPVGTRPLPGTMIYSCLLKDEYHMGLII